jgi:hypothetical protein
MREKADEQELSGEHQIITNKVKKEISAILDAHEASYIFSFAIPLGKITDEVSSGGSSVEGDKEEFDAYAIGVHADIIEGTPRAVVLGLIDDLRKNCINIYREVSVKNDIDKKKLADAIGVILDAMN